MFGVIFGIVSVMTVPAMIIPVIIIAIILAIILAFPLLGYTVRMYRGETPAPQVNNWGSLFADGSKLFIILLIGSFCDLFLLLRFWGASSWR